MAVKIYGCSWAVSVQRAILCLVEKGVEFELVHVDLDAMEHKKPEYLDLQPFGKVPYIEDGDLKLYGFTKMRDIQRYLTGEDAGFQVLMSLIGVYNNNPKKVKSRCKVLRSKVFNEGPALLGKTLEERALVDQWVDVEAMTFDPLVFQVVFNLIILPRLGVPSDKAAAHVALQKLDKVLDIYENRLSRSKYLAGEEFSLADLSHVPATRHLMENANLSCIFAGRKNFRAWWDDISGRPTWKKVLSLVDRG